MTMEKATFGAGCFWSVEAAFKQIKGVLKTRVGFMGGKVKNPSYTLVCTSLTGHAEVCQVTYDSKKVSYQKLLETFWKIHDPTRKNRQGFDIGSQYRSIIFYHNEQQKAAAMASKEKQQKKTKNKIITEIVPAQPFYRAEEYHQRYLEKRGVFTCH